MRSANYTTQFRRVAVLAVPPVIPAVLLMDGRYGAAELFRGSQLVTYALVLAAALLVHFHWRTASVTPSNIVDARLRGWLTVALVMVGLYGLVLAALLDQISTPRRDAWPLVGLIVLVLTVTVLARAAASAELPGEPVLVGAVGGLGLVAATCLILSTAPPLVVSPIRTDLLNSTLMLAGLLLAWTVLTRPQIADWARRRLALAATLLTLAHFAANLDWDHWPVVALAVGANLYAAVALGAMCHTLMRQSVLDHEQELVALHESLAQVRANLHEDRELLHEVGSTVAGITTASTVMRQGPVSPQRRQRLEQMLAAELGRLERLINSSVPSEVHAFDIEEVVRPLVISHQERGLDVRWTPSRLRVMGAFDDLAEVVNILLENARRHGGRTVQIDVTGSGGHVEIRCSDDGPGVAAEVRTQLFTSGVRRPDSPGQGLGLSIAQRLMSDRGGSLELADSVNPGATFVARLPTSELADAVSHHVA